MDLRAKVVLEDCRGALGELRDGVQGSEWRRRWITAVVLLRAVGHVLHNVDKKQSSEVARAVDKWWEELLEHKPEPRIFWEFIVEERNNVIKEYDLGAGQDVTVSMEPPCSLSHGYPMVSGRFAGSDQRDVIAEAIQWWEVQISQIESPNP